MDTSSISLNLNELRERIERAAQKSRRRAEDILVVAVTKTHPIATIREVLDFGLRHLGENKVQEARPKIEAIGSAATWHMVGHLQKNKARDAVQLFDQIDSVDSLELARELNRHANEAGKTIPVLLQVNVVGESSKFGVPPGQSTALAEAINALPRLQLNGLMTLAPYHMEPEKARPAFAGLRECRDHIAASTGLQLPVLSMGMSHDFEIAIEEGSTVVRIGTALFGPRQKTAKTRAAEET